MAVQAVLEVARDVGDFPRYLTVAEAARVLDVPESRFRASWRQNGICPAALTKGLTQVRRQDVVRAAVLVSLQAIFGEQSGLAVELAKAATSEQLDALLVASTPTLQVTRSGVSTGRREFTVELDRDYLAQVRNQIAQVPA